jgi:hypothetical protein
MEEKVIIAGPETLEGRFGPGTQGGVIITHPHPLYGGDLDNTVVWTAARAFQARKLATLRFNFRGVGESSGTYGEGRGEIEDLAAALEFLKTRTAGPCYVAGYSFGAYVAAQALLNGLEVQGAVLISPPVAFMPMPFLPRTPRLALIIAGDRDEICPLTALRQLLAQGPAPVELAVIPGADHFFGGQEEELFRVLTDCPLNE